MADDLIILGVGELGQLYGGGALRAGFRVTPWLRGDDARTRLRDLSPGVPILVAVAEDDLDAAVARVPAAWRDDVCLLQNELFPSWWREAGLRSPTVIVPWVLKKRGLPVTLLRPTPVYGPHASDMARIHAALRLPCVELTSEAALGQALVSKYAFILAINVLGLIRDVSVGEWLEDASGSLNAVIDESITIGEARLGHAVERATVRDELAEAMRALGPFPAKGRTARSRLERACAIAERHALAVPVLRGLV